MSDSLGIEDRVEELEKCVLALQREVAEMKRKAESGRYSDMGMMFGALTDSILGDVSRDENPTT